MKIELLEKTRQRVRCPSQKMLGWVIPKIAAPDPLGMIVSPGISQMRRTPDHYHGVAVGHLNNLAENLNWFAQMFYDLKKSDQIELAELRTYLVNFSEIANIGIDTASSCGQDIFA